MYLTSSELFYLDDTPEEDFDIVVAEHTSLEMTSYEIVVVSHIDGSRMPIRMKQKSMEYKVGGTLKVEWEMVQDRPTPTSWDDFNSDPLAAIERVGAAIRAAYEQSLANVEHHLAEYVSGRSWGKNAATAATLKQVQGLRLTGGILDEANVTIPGLPLAAAADRLDELGSKFVLDLDPADDEGTVIKRCPTHGKVLTLGGICLSCVMQTSSTSGSSAGTILPSVTNRPPKKPGQKN